MLAFLFFSSVALAHPLCPFEEAKLKPLLNPVFRQQMKPLREGLLALEARLGKCISIEGKVPDLRLRFEQGEVPAHIGLSKKKLWESVALGNPEYSQDNAEKISATAKKLGAALIAEGDSKLAIRADEKSSVGELVYLLALAKYRAKVKSGEMKPSQVVVIPENAAAFSPGPLGHWPTGVPLTLESAAHLAFRSRDNMAGDLLLRAVSPTEWFAYADLNRLLQIARPEAESLWAAGPPLKKSLPLAEPLAPIAESNGMEDKIGWFATVRALCEAAGQVQGDAVFQGQEEPGMPDEVNGAFPGTVAYAKFGKVKDRWVCAAIAMPRRSEESYTWARDLLERAFLFAGKEGQKTGR